VSGGSLQHSCANGSSEMKARIGSAVIGVAMACLLVEGAQAYLHWYAGTQTDSTAQSMRRWYLSHDPLNGKAYHQGFVDLILPSILLGLAAGWITACTPKRVLVWSVFLLSIGVVALFPYYAVVIPTPESDEWWRHASNETRALALIPGYFKAALLCLFFGAVGRGVAQSVRGVKQDL